MKKKLLIMKLSAILLLASCLQVSAKGYSQSVTLSEKNVTLQKIFSEIKKQTGYVFFYDEAWLQKSQKVTIDVKDLPLKEVLDICFSNQPLTYSIVDRTIVVKEKLKGSIQPFDESDKPDPPVKITGIVLSPDKTPLPGATISLKGTNTGTTTDAAGRFSLEAPNNKGVLVISFIGYAQQEIPFSSASNISVVLLSDDKKIDEIVVVGYSDKKRSELTSAVQVVDEATLKDVTANNIGTMLQGKVAGLQVVNSSGVPGAGPEIRLRGISSVNATQTPLFVVDGIIGGNYDPNDVESVTILKDAGATAMYGSQANGGVIIISTKKAKAGKTQFHAKLVTGVRVPDFGEMDMMNGSQLYNYQKEFYRDYIPQEQDNSYKIDLLKFYGERPRSLENQNNNWLKTIFKPALIQNYYFSLSGKTEKTDYYFGASYYDEEGTFMNTNFKRLNLRANTTYRLSDKISLTNNINLSANNGRNYDYMDIYYAYLNLPWDNPYDSTGNALYVDGNSAFKWWSRDKINPVHTIENSKHTYKGFDVNYDLALNISITNWLSFSSSNRFAASINKGSNYFSPAVAGTYHNSGYLDQSDVLNYGMITNNLLKFNFLTGNHRISGLAGIAFERSKWEMQGGSGRGLPPGLDVLNVVSNNIRVTGYTNESYILSYISQLNYSYLNRYFLTGSFRTDGSSNFPEANRYASFPSISAAWQINNEPFFKSSFIDNLKIRASYGITGTQDIGSSRYLGLYSLSTQYNSLAAATPLQLPSPNLTWESKQQVNAGLDISFHKRVALTVDLYRNITKDLLLQVSQPLSVGFEQRWENIGEIENKGIEVGINTINIRNSNFEWSTDFNINFNSNKLQKLPSTVIKTGQWAISQIYRNGGNLYEFYMPKWAGVDEQTGAPLWEKQTKDAQGNITKTEVTSNYAEATYQELGSALPKFQGGITNQFRYKNFSLSVNAYFLYGNKVFSNSLRFVMNDGNEPYMNQIVLPLEYSIWKNPGDIATNPSPQNSANSTETSSRYLKDGSYISIRNISLAYALPSSLVQRWQLNGITLSVSADNVYTFTKFLGQDPQTTITPTIYVTPGVSDFKYPNNRQILFNINLKF